MQPCADTIVIMLALPDWHPRLDFIDHPAARRERGVAMAGADPDPDREIAQRQCADPVHRLGIDDLEAGTRLMHDPLAFAERQLAIDLVIERLYRLAQIDRKSTRLNSSHYCASRKPSSACKQNHEIFTPHTDDN